MKMFRVLTSLERKGSVMRNVLYAKISTVLKLKPSILVARFSLLEFVLDTPINALWLRACKYDKYFIPFTIITLPTHPEISDHIINITTLLSPNPLNYMRW